ncbi:hypothetical protein [Blautia massiliensis (ex Durand et al. 2017)]|uniref:hypothetical protein n=1 Tax=Blautia massiliensis (ex Durand et al. 2017) TaxID=1737424 RepID=UPI0022DF9038|nr:hypothetical protein [Blautia massiliensis (ex Durand et al. 2017)]
MLGIIYLILCMLTGMEMAGCLFPRQTTERGNRIWVVLPAAFGMGILMLTWAVYILSWMFSICARAEHPLFYGNLIVFLVDILLLSGIFRWKKKKQQKMFVISERMISRKWILKKELLLFGILTVFVTWMMFYVFHMKDGILYSGFSVYGDYAPHTAMMRSFSRGNNFPTQYPHYGGQDVKYHFMFQFLVGNLEYLGLRLDLGYNLVSILSLAGFLMVLYGISYRMFKSFWAGAAAIVFFFFRSGTAFWRYLWEHLQAGDLVRTLEENTAFIGYTTNENWGLWNFNVYLNQRHLAFGLLMAAVAVWIFMDWVEAGCSHKEQGFLWVRNRFFTKEAWICRNAGTAILLGLFLGLTAFWNGAALIGGLLILAGLAVFSDGKLDYMICAGLAVLFSELQSKIFVSGSVMSPSFYWGFLADNKSISGVLWYLVEISGFFFVGMIVAAVFLKRSQRAVLMGCLLPVVFAFLVSLTPDINVNHKYVMISYAFVTVFWGWIVRCVFLEGKKGWKKWAGRAAAAVLCICLSATGIYDYVIILRDNDSAHRMTVNMESSLTDWLSANLKKNDLLLTPEYTMNEVTMSGVMLYCGWPYYAWSAGYDTGYRAGQAVLMYTTDDPELLKAAVKQEKITYILFEEDMEFEQQECREDIIRETYPLVYTSEDGRIRIYET